MPKRSKRFGQIAVSITAILILVLSIIYFEAYPFDTNWYHLLFAAKQFSISDYDSLNLSLGLQNRFDGFPPLWRLGLLPGLITHSPRLLFIPNIIAALLSIYTIRGFFSLTAPQAFLGLIVSPIVLYGFRSSYQDFFVATMILSGLIEGIKALSLNKPNKLYLMTALLALASLTKYQGYLQSTIAVFVLLVACTALLRKRLATNKHLLLLLGCFLVISLQPLYNLLVFQNPFYPIESNYFQGPEPQPNSLSSPMYTLGVPLISNSLNHFSSMTELDWVFRGVVPSYSLDMPRSQVQHGGSVDSQALRSMIRSGGSLAILYVPSLLISLNALFTSIKRAKRLALNGDPLSLSFVPLSIIFSYLLLVSALPQSHELRYYMSTIIFPVLIALSSICSKLGQNRANLILLVYISLTAALVFGQPIFSSAKELAKYGHSNYLTDYPNRDLPSKKECIDRLEIVDGRLGIGDGNAFPCFKYLKHLGPIEAR